MPTEENSKHHEHTADKPLLTPREREIIILICEEYSNKQIAGILNISPWTVETHKKSIREKTASLTVVGVVKYALLNNIYVKIVLYILSLCLGDGFDLPVPDMLA
jgi:DNA-binding CsgD family transcriptional regulator